jgi:hypothetical protein
MPKMLNASIITEEEILDLAESTAENTAIEKGNVEKRQTVLYGSVDATGYANFLTGTGTGTLTLDATPTPVVATWASGDVNYKKTIDEDLTLDISGYDDGTYYAYIDYNNGTPLLASTSLVPTDGYGVGSTTSGQHHFRIPEMKMYVGDGSAYAEALHLFVGEFVVASNVISGTPVTYALRGEWYSPIDTSIAGADVNVYTTHGLLSDYVDFFPLFTVKTAFSDFSIGDKFSGYQNTGIGGSSKTPSVLKRSGTIYASFYQGDGNIFYVADLSGASNTAVPFANVSFQLLARRSY